MSNTSLLIAVILSMGVFVVVAVQLPRAQAQPKRTEAVAAHLFLGPMTTTPPSEFWSH